MTLTEFLLARIAEDEADAKAAVDRHHHPQWVVDGMGICTVGGHDLDSVTEYVRHEEAAPHVARHDPARVLAECDAKRRIVASPPYSREEGADNDSALREWTRVCRLLTLPYADHPDYRDEWRL